MMVGGREIARRCFAAALVTFVPLAALAQSTECESGEREVRALEFRGTEAFRASDLGLRVVTTASDVLRRNLRILGVKRCLDSDELKLDVGRLRVFYRRHGYYGATVDTSVTALLDGYGGGRVTFVIHEGLPVHVDTLRISGLDSVVAPIVDTSDLGLHRGITFDITRIQASIDSLKARLRNDGYPRGDVAASYSVFDSAGRRASVNIAVVPGSRARIGAILLRDAPLPGAPRRLSDATIRRLLGIQEGALYREREIIDAQRTLYQSDLFRHVEVSIAADSARPLVDSLVTLDVLVAENFLRQLDTEEGWAVLDCFKGRAQFIDKSFFGEARRLELTSQVSKVGYGEPTRVASGNLCAPKIRADTFSAKLNYFLGATMRLPTLFGLRASPSLSLYSERRGEYQAFLRTTLVGGEASVSHDVAYRVPLRLAYALEYGRTEAQPALLCALFSRCDSESRALLTERDRPLAVASAHLERVRTDNLVNPRSGTTIRLDLRGAAREIGSDPDIQFVKALSDASVYHGLTTAVTLALRVRLGTVLNRTLSFGDAVGYVPPEERLYAGGAGSVRGFQQNELGKLIYISEDNPTTTHGGGDTVYVDVSPNSQVRRVVPVGGNSLIVANFEMRVRSPFLPELIQYTFFADAGDVWQRGIAIGAADHKAAALYLNDLRWTPGIGVRVFTPVGPFQANVGYNPYPRPAGAIYYDQAPNAQGFAPLYCVSPGNRIPAVVGKNNVVEQVPGIACPATFQPSQSNTFLSHLTLTFSIGPDF